MLMFAGMLIFLFGMFTGVLMLVLIVANARSNNG